MASIRVATSNAYFFNNASNNDICFFTNSNASQQILFGSISNVIAPLTISNSNISISGDLNFGGILKKNGVPYVGSQWSNNLSNVFLMSSNVGIGKMYPTYPLDVAGDLNFDGILRKGGVPYVGSQWSNILSNVVLMSSNIGIGKIYPSYPLDVAGDINFGGILRKNGLPYIGSQWSNNSSNVFLMSSNVGIGKMDPQATLDIVGTLNVSSNVTINGNMTVSNLGINNPNPQSQLDIIGTTTMRGDLQINNAVAIKGLTIMKRDGTMANITTSSVTGFSNTSNGVLISMLSNTSSNSFVFMASNTTIATLNGTGNLYLGSNVGPGYSNYPTDLSGNTGNIITSGNICAGNLGMFRNRIINGDMRINQRGINTLTISSSGINFLVDRFATNVSITSGSFTMSNIPLISTDAPRQNGISNSMRITINTAIVGTYCLLHQCIEGYNIQDFNWGYTNGVPIAISFWYKSNLASGSLFPITITTNTGNTYCYSTTFTTSTSGVWQYVIINVPAPPVNSSWTTGNGIGFFVTLGSFHTTSVYNTATSGWQLSANTIWQLTTGVNFWTTANNYIEFTGLQLEKGKIATPFEFRPYHTELQLCQRYYYKLNLEANAYVFTAPYWNPNWVCVNIPLPTFMRVVPTLILPNALTIMPSYQQPQQNITDYHIFNFYGNYMFVQMGGASVVGLISGNTYYVMSTTVTSIGFTSEL